MKNGHVSARMLLTAPALLVALAATSAHAGLGSFSPNDGYSLSVFTGSANWCDVTYYNAGGYGINSGGGPGPTNIAPNTGKWKLISNAGGFFPTAALRTAAISGTPPYPNAVPPGTQPIYMVGDHGPGRTDNSSLAFRNDTAQGSSGPAVYDYAMDIYDTGGPVPASVTGGTVSYGIYFNSSPTDPINPGHLPLDRFTQSIMDSSGNIGAQWGYSRDNHLVWRANASGPWTYTGIYANPGMWDGISIDVNLTTDTFKLDYYNVLTSTWTNLAPAGTALGVPMTNFTGLRWQLEDGTNNGVGGKNFFDDAKFTIPSPGTLALLGIGALATSRRRRA